MTMMKMTMIKNDNMSEEFIKLPKKWLFKKIDHLVWSMVFAGFLIGFITATMCFA
jgi:hypothetical protein